MSTKAIGEALDMVDVDHPMMTDEQRATAAQAKAEWEAIKKACRTLEAESIGDFVYEVRNRAASDTEFKGNTWEHPRVVAYGKAAQVITNIAKESEA